MAYSGIPAAISNGLMAITDNKYILLLLMNIILLVIGMFMDITPAILIFTPIFLPIAESLGMSAIQFGVMLIFNMCMGSMTPPVGSVLFVSCGISKITDRAGDKDTASVFCGIAWYSAGSYLYTGIVHGNSDLIRFGLIRILTI